MDKGPGNSGPFGTREVLRIRPQEHVLCSRSFALIVTGNLAHLLSRPGVRLIRPAWACPKPYLAAIPNRGLSIPLVKVDDLGEVSTYRLGVFDQTGLGLSQALFGCYR